MSRFNFTTTPETFEYCEEVVRCLIQYGHKAEDEAIALVNRYWSDEPSFGNDDFRLHEPPYFWAMCIVYHPELGRSYPNWWDDPNLWPPPEDFLRRWYGVNSPE